MVLTLTSQVHNTQTHRLAETYIVAAIGLDDRATLRPTDFTTLRGVQWIRSNRASAVSTGEAVSLADGADAYTYNKNNNY